MKSLVVAFCLMIGSLPASAQMNKGEINIFQHEKIDELLRLHKQVNADMMENMNDDGVYGYRIQIYFDSGNNSKQRATDVMEDFILEHPETGAYIMFTEPWYKVRVGDFRTKLEALGFLQKIKSTYPDAFIIKDMIHFPGSDNINNQIQ